jgi:hypothetical protein
MDEKTTLGPYLRRERERRGLTLKAISDSTKVSIFLLEGLEADDVSRWPGGIFRRAFVRSYAQCVGLDPDDVVRRFEEQHRPPQEIRPSAPAHPPASAAKRAADGRLPDTIPPSSRRARLQATAADLTVAMMVAFGSAAAGSRLLWPVLVIAAYYSIGILLTGTSPMMALLGDAPSPSPAQQPAARPQPEPEATPVQPAASRPSDRRHSRRVERARHRRNLHARAN